MSLFGLSPLGTELGPSGGPGLITVLGVLPASVSSFIVVFDRPPFVFDSAAARAANNASNYEMTSIDPTIYPPLALVPTLPPGKVVPTRQVFPAVATVDRADPKQVIVDTDAKMDPKVDHVVHVNANIRGVGGETFAGPQDWVFTSVNYAPDPESPAAQALAKYRDFAWQFDSDAGAWKYDPNNDIGIAGRLASLRSRIYRRVFTSPGGFAFLPTYGVGVALKGLGRAAARQGLADTVAQQALLEPEVVDASADVRLEHTDRGSVVYISLYVRLASGDNSTINYQAMADD